MTGSYPWREGRTPTRTNQSLISRGKAHHIATCGGATGPGPSPQLGQTFRTTVSTLMQQNVHSKLQIVATGESACNDATSCSHTGRRSSMETSRWKSASRPAKHKPVIARGRCADDFGHGKRAQSIGRRSAISVLTGSHCSRSAHRAPGIARSTVVTTCASQGGGPDASSFAAAGIILWMGVRLAETFRLAVSCDAPLRLGDILQGPET